MWVRVPPFPESSFGDAVPYKDRDKQRAYQREWARRKFSSPANAAKRRATRSKWRDAHREELRANHYGVSATPAIRQRKQRQRLSRWQIIGALKAARGCARCNERNPNKLHFHHYDPSTKRSEISTLIAQNMSMASILAEIKKCILLCASCHQREHMRLRYGDRR